jgi:hypothetical protein
MPFSCVDTKTKQQKAAAVQPTMASSQNRVYPLGKQLYNMYTCHTVVSDQQPTRTYPKHIRMSPNNPKYMLCRYRGAIGNGRGVASIGRDLMVQSSANRVPG